MLRSVAGAATDARMLAIKQIPGSGVVKALRRGIPMQQREVLPIVVGVAFHASRPGRSRL